MEFLAAGPTGIDDWLQAIILILVIAGSALGAISKKLIEFFSPQDNGGSAPRGRSDDAGRRGPPAPPSARPIPGHGRAPSERDRTSPEMPPWLRRAWETPSRGKAGRRAVETVPPPARPVQRRERPVKPAPPPTPKPRHQRPGPGRKPARVIKEPTGLEPAEVSTGEVALGQLSSLLEETAAKRKAVKTRHPPSGRARRGRRADVIGPVQEEPDVHPVSDTVAGLDLDLNTPASLRRAIVLSEILGPPIALRDHDALPYLR